MKKEVYILDTNIWISFLLSKKYDTLVKIILENNFEVVTCKNLVTEFEQVLQRKKFKKYIRKNEINEAVKIHLKLCTFIHIELKANELTDRKDNYLLDLYRAAHASIIVTGDKQLNTQASKLGFKVITLVQFENTVS
jgi:putative PIN family toxin of toxin-antitoxin system